MTEELDRSSTDALHWAEQFCKTLKKINRAKYRGRGTDIDVGWVQGWFANYWAAVHDPLQKQIFDLQEKYHELLWAVEKKFPDETRHQTALRYITQAEQTVPESEAKEDVQP